MTLSIRLFALFPTLKCGIDPFNDGATAIDFETDASGTLEFTADVDGK
ncbi:MAG: hypothetical protein LRY73_10120 [Bacillus sp. (in: Bacteria)]|nr:hypothetical protein [Bacillus sp. (in: firmicutes)]